MGLHPRSAKPINQPGGLHADLIIPVMLPAGTTGGTITMTATVSTSSPERSLANNRGEVSLRYVTPEPADLQIIDMSATPAQVVAGEQIEIGLQVENLGGSPADNVRVRVPLPDTVEPVSADLTGPDWTCSVISDAETGQRVWECAHPRYEPHSIEYLSRIILTATVGAGTPEGTLRFVATARTDSPELSTDNNAGEASTTYRAQGFISGQVWLDQDRDGQREPGEPPVGTAPDGVLSLWFMKEGLTWPGIRRRAGSALTAPTARSARRRTSRPGATSSEATSALRWTSRRPTPATTPPIPTSRSRLAATR